MAIHSEMMKAVQIASFGGPEVIRHARIDRPQPQAGEVLLKVHAASVNPVDWKIRAGKYPDVRSDQLPYTLGRDVSGVVVACGPGEAAFIRGSSLYAFLDIDRGGFAEYVVVGKEEATAKPESLDHVAAAAVPLAGLTAWQGLYRHGGLQARQRVLIHAGSGGVGHFAVQFAKATGAYVVTTVSTDNVEFARQLGADEVIDHTRQKFDDRPQDIDVVLDLIGGSTQERSWGVLKRGGVLVSTVAEPSQQVAASRGVRALRFTAQPAASQLRDIAALIDGGKVKPRVSRTFPLAEAIGALQSVESGHNLGKVVLTVSE
jgi:NADPH:quinone reductase-like Zn-dependent oxidoreductase